MDKETAIAMENYQELLASLPKLFVFGYGSLIWKPGFEYINHYRMEIKGYHRRFGLISTHYRGSETNPGLVLGLDYGGACQGVAFEVSEANRAQVAQYLWDREMVSLAYRPVLVMARLSPFENDERPRFSVPALSFALNPSHHQYQANLTIAETYQRIRHSWGLSGSNINYLLSTGQALQAHKIHDADLEILYQMAYREFGDQDTRPPPENG